MVFYRKSCGNEEHSGTDPSTQNTDYDVSTTPNSTDVESKNDTAGQILINEIPIRDIIGMSAEEIIEIFGQPDAYNECASVEYSTLSSGEMIFNLSEMYRTSKNGK